MKHKLTAAFERLLNQDRDPRYIIALLWSVPLFALTYLQAYNTGWFDSVEKPVFTYINDWPAWLGGVMYLITQMGGLGGLLLWLPLAWYLINRRAALTVLAGGVAGWFVAKIFKTTVERGRPEEYLQQINLFNDQVYGGFGFPSGHSTFVAACVTVLYYQVRPSYRKYLVLAALLVGLSRMYLGAHFPLDVVGGWALGVASGSLVVLLAGRSVRLVKTKAVRKALERKGYEIESLRFASVDARGSSPVIVTTKDKQTIFGKVFSEQEHAADWLFKLYRFFRYKNLRGEEPYLNGRRNIELESFANLWALKAGVRSPQTIDIIRVGRQWLSLQSMVDGTPMTDRKRLKETELEDAWRQVKKLHEGNMAHRDLRAANIMLDTKGKAWIIDYGFAEVAPDASRKNMDVAELLMSMSAVAGEGRTVAAACKVMGKDVVRKALPYLQKSVFSGATNEALKQDKQLLSRLRQTLGETLGVDEEEIKVADVDRITGKKLLNFGLFAVFVYVVIPQFSQFKQSLGYLHDLHPLWLLLLVLASAGTYVAAGGVLVSLASVPIRLRQSAIIQLAASFMSKVLPGGLGSVGINARYLVKQGLDKTEASVVIAGQAAIGVIMFVVLLAITLVMNGRGIGAIFDVHIPALAIMLLAAVSVLAGLAILASRKLRTKVRDAARKFLSNLTQLSSSPRELILAALSSLGVSLTYIVCLIAAVQAVGADVRLADVILIYATAMVAKSAVPTPGGLGPVEVAMSAGLIGVGLPAGQAFAIVILYRLATFWLPVPFSVLAYKYATNRKLI